jgi:hypothetical protein
MGIDIEYNEKKNIPTIKDGDNILFHYKLPKHNQEINKIFIK